MGEHEVGGTVKGFPIIGETPFPRLVPVGKNDQLKLFSSKVSNNKKCQVMDKVGRQLHLSLSYKLFCW